MIIYDFNKPSDCNKVNCEECEICQNVFKFENYFFRPLKYYPNGGFLSRSLNYNVYQVIEKAKEFISFEEELAKVEQEIRSISKIDYLPYQQREAIKYLNTTYWSNIRTRHVSKEDNIENLLQNLIVRGEIIEKYQLQDNELNNYTSQHDERYKGLNEKERLKKTLSTFCRGKVSWLVGIGAYPPPSDFLDEAEEIHNQILLTGHLPVWKKIFRMRERNYWERVEEDNVLAANAAVWG